MFLKTLLVVALLAAGTWAYNIVPSDAEMTSLGWVTGSGAIKATSTVDVPITSYSGSSSSAMTLRCKFWRFAAPKANMPLMVVFVEWGGSIDGAASRIYDYDRFDSNLVICVIMPQSSGSDANTDSWYWGKVYNGKSNPWCHNAVIKLINDMMYNNWMSANVWSGAVVDPNRVYCGGHSIGGTATQQIGLKHGEVFAAYSAHAGWTTYWDRTNTGSNAFFADDRGCLSFAGMIGGTSAAAPAYCDVVPSVTIRENEDCSLYVATTATTYPAYLYTDLSWVFGKTGSDYNLRDPSWETPYAFFQGGNQDDPQYQGDVLQPVLEEGKRPYSYNRMDGGHSVGCILQVEYLLRFKRNQSFLAFTNRNYGLTAAMAYSDATTDGMYNDLKVHGWDPDSIIDQADTYHVKLTGTGTSDVTLRRLQNLTHTPGTVYDVTINGSAAGQAVADAYGLVTIPSVSNAASLTLSVSGAPADVTPPAAIADLTAAPGTANGSVDLTWTATGDDGSTGTATSYDLRYSTSAINAGNFGSATAVTGEPSPKASGQAEAMTITGLIQGQTYYFAIKASDGINTSAISNVISATATQGGTPTLDSVDCPVVADNFLENVAPDDATPYGADERLKLKSWNQGVILLKFDMSSVSFTIGSGKVLLTESSWESGQIAYTATVAGITTDWDEATSCYLETSTGNAWPGGSPASNLANAGSNIVYDGTYANLVHAFEVPAVVLTDNLGGSNYGIAIRDVSTLGLNNRFFSREHGAPTAPVLRIYNDGAAQNAAAAPRVIGDAIVIAPNPFNPSASVTFSFAGKERALVAVYGIDGKLVRTLFTGWGAGTRTIVWDAKDAHGNRVHSGMYVVRLMAGNRTVSRNAILLK